MRAANNVFILKDKVTEEHPNRTRIVFGGGVSATRLFCCCCCCSFSLPGKPGVRSREYEKPNGVKRFLPDIFLALRYTHFGPTVNVNVINRFDVTRGPFYLYLVGEFNQYARGQAWAN